MKMNETMKRAVAITVVSLLVVAMLVPVAIAGDPQQIMVKSTTGVKDETGAWLLGDGSETSDLVQLINASSDPHSHICYIRIGEGVSPLDYDKGKFSYSLSLESGTVIYCRAWNAPSVAEANCSGDSGTLTVVGAGDYDFGTWSTTHCDPGPEPPVPELPTIILLSIGLLVLVGYICLRRKKG